MKILNQYKTFLYLDKLLEYNSIFIANARGTGKSYQIALIFVILALRYKNTHFTVARATNKQVMETIYPEFIKILNKLKIKVKWYPKKQTFEFSNGNTIWLQGARPSSAIGIPFSGQTAPLNCENFISWAEEVSEWPSDYFTNFLQGVGRGAKNKTHIFTSNPWLKSNWYIKMLDKWMAFDKEKLKKEKWIEKDINDPMFGKIKVCQATIYSNPLLPKTNLEGILLSVKADPWKEDPVIWGFPGVLGNVIYANLLPYTKWDVVDKNYVYQDFSIGVDFGEITDNTTAVLGVMIKDYKELHILEEFEIRPEEYVRRDQMAVLVYNKIVEWIKKYKLRSIEVTVDNSATVFIDKLKELNKYVDVYGDTVIRIYKSSKYPILERIDVTKFLMAESKLKLKEGNLRTEFATSMWEVNKSTGEPIEKRVDGNDHMINAFEYMLEKWHKHIHNQL